MRFRLRGLAYDNAGEKWVEARKLPMKNQCEKSAARTGGQGGLAEGRGMGVGEGRGRIGVGLDGGYARTLTYPESNAKRELRSGGVFGKIDQRGNR